MEPVSDSVPRGPPSRGASTSSPPPVASLPLTASSSSSSSSPTSSQTVSSPRARRMRANTLDPMQPSSPPFVTANHDALYDSIHLYTVRSRRGGLRERSRLNKTISKLARNELTRRTSVSLKAAIRPNREGHIFDYFCVVGYPPSVKVEIKATSEQRRQEPVILYQYPQDNLLNEQVVHFCFPNGVTPSVSQRRKTSDKSFTTLELAKCTMKEVKDSERSFLFLMTGTGALLYGICVSQNELLSCLEKPSFFNQPAYNPSVPLTHAELRYDISAPRVYCLLSRFPFFKLHFNVLYSLLETERVIQKEALERVQKQSGALVSKAIGPPSTSDAEEDSNKDEEKEKKTWNWRWKWGKDKDKNDSTNNSIKDSKSPIPKMSRTSSANSFSAWGVKKTIKEEQNLSPRGTRTGDQAQDEVKIIPSPQSGPADGRDKSTGADNNKGSATPFVSPPRTRTRSSSKGESEASLRTHKRSHSRVRSLFALGSNKIERDQPDEEANDTHEDEEPAAHETPFPGIRLHQQHEAASDSPFPGIRLRICTEEDRGSGSVTSPSQEVRQRSGTDDENTDNTTKEKNKVLALLEAYYNANIRTSLGSFALNLPTAGKQDKFICPEGDEEKLIMEWCAPTMLRLVPLPNVIVLLRALLQEYKVVLLCKNLGVLSFIAMALLPLLRPFEWQGPFIPLVPKNLEECVESPVPCVLGMPTTTEDDLIPLVDDCLIVNIETEQVVLPERQLSPLPHEEELYTQLGVYHSKIYQPAGTEARERAFHRPSKSTDEEQAITAGFLNVVRSYMEKLVQEIVNVAHIHCISESTPCPSLPVVPPVASPTLSAPTLPTLASSASYSAILQDHDYDDLIPSAASIVSLDRTRIGSRPPSSVSSPSSASTTPRGGVSQHSYSLAMPSVQQLDDSDEDSEGADITTKDPKRRVLDNHQQWARTRSDNVESSGLDEEKKKKKKSGKKAPVSGLAALTQTLPDNRELQDIKAKVEIDRIPSPSGLTQGIAYEQSSKDDQNSDYQSDEEEQSTDHPLRAGRTLSFSASALPVLDTSSEAGDESKKAKNQSDRVVPPLPIRVRGSPLSVSDQSASSLPGSSSPSASPEQQRRINASSSSAASHAPGTPMLVLSLRPSIPPLESQLPQLVASTFEWTDMNQLKTLVRLFPVTQQRFMSNFLFTQHFTVFTERLNAIYGKGQHNSNVLTPRSAARFLEQLKKMIEQEESQAMMARSLLQIYAMLEQQKEVVGSMLDEGGEPHPSTSPSRHGYSTSETDRQPNRKSVLGIPLSSTSDFGLGKKRDSTTKLGGSSVGVRGEATSPIPSPSPMSKRPGHRRQGSVGGQEILKVKPEEEIEQGEEGKEQKNMEQIIKLSAERLRILSRSKDMIKALFSSDSPSSSQSSSPLLSEPIHTGGSSLKGLDSRPASLQTIPSSRPSPLSTSTRLQDPIKSPRLQAIKREEPHIEIIVSESPTMDEDRGRQTEAFSSARSATQRRPEPIEDTAANFMRGNKKIRGGRRKGSNDYSLELREDEEA